MWVFWVLGLEEYAGWARSFGGFPERKRPEKATNKIAIDFPPGSDTRFKHI